MAEPHVLFVALATHGHFNPGLHLAQTLSDGGVHVTFATSASVRRRIPKLPSSPRLSFAFFSDGHDDGFQPGNDVVPFLSQFELQASTAIRLIILKSQSNAQNPPFTFVIYSLLTPWMAALSRSFNLPSALFWNQSTSVFAIYHHFFNGYKTQIRNSFSDPSLTIQLPNLPALNSNQLPSLCHPSNSNSSVLNLFESHFQILKQEPHLKILINTFHDLEHHVLRAIPNVNLIPIGPVFKIPAHISSELNKPYIGWLNSKPKRSVVYVSFGSIQAVSKTQLEEIAKGLLEFGAPFVWVMRKMGSGNEGDWLSCRQELERKGKLVTWCSQVEVLSNAATGCFVTHCGWNSTVESLGCGVPVVGFPQWTDQGTNAKIVEEYSKTGVRLRLNEDGIVEGGEIRRCLETVMGDHAQGHAFRINALKWKDLANSAVHKTGSSTLNIGAFLADICSLPNSTQ